MKKTKWDKRVNVTYRDKKFLIENYINSNNTLRDIAKIADCKVDTIMKWLKIYGLEKDPSIASATGRKNREATHLKIYGVKNNKQVGKPIEKYGDKLQLIQLYIEKNMTTAEIAQSLGVGKTTIKRWLNKFNIKKESTEIKKIRISSMIKTNLNKYGVKYTAQVPKFASKAATALKKTILKTHWLTGKKLACVGRFEVAVVEYLNFNKINYLWQPSAFKIPNEVFMTKKGNDSYYIPDLYLTDADKWVEIKGKFLRNSYIKWSWFYSEHPTAELWDYKYLKSHGIIKG